MRGILIYGLIIAVFSAMLVVSTAFFGRDERPNAGLPAAHDHPALEAAFEEQRAHAAAIGLAELREGESGFGRGGSGNLTVRLEAGECVAFIAGATGCQDLGSMSIRTADGATTVTTTQGGSVVTQVQWCAFGEPSTLRLDTLLRARMSCLPGHRDAGGLRFEARRGPMPADGMAGLNAIGTPSDEAVLAARSALARAWLDAHPPEGRSLVRGDLAGYDDGALVRPGTAATCHAAYAITNRGADIPVHPRLDWPASDVECPPGDAVGEPIDAVRRRGESTPDRILAVLDLGDLGAPCVEARVARLRGGDVATAPVVFDVATDQESPMTPLESAGFAFTHRACPARGLVAYTVSGADHAGYRVEVSAVDGPPDAVAEAASDPSDPFPTDRPLSDDASEHQRLCDRRRGSASACQALAMAYRTGQGAPQDLARAAELFERACDLGDADGCAYLAHAYGEGEGVAEDDAEAARRYRAACTQGSALACAYVGDLERATDGAPAEAMQRARDHYQTACDAGIQSACANRDLLGTLNLL